MQRLHLSGCNLALRQCNTARTVACAHVSESIPAPCRAAVLEAKQKLLDLALQGFSAFLLDSGLQKADAALQVRHS